jgi:hypothetical protein
MKKALLSLFLLAAMPGLAVDYTFGEYSIWCDNMGYTPPGTSTDLIVFQPEGSDIDKVTSAYGTHSTSTEGHWKVEFDLKVTSLEKDRPTPLLYMELTATSKKGGNGNGDGVIKTAWVMFDQAWTGKGYLRTAGGTLIRLECTRGKKSSPRE